MSGHVVRAEVEWKVDGSTMKDIEEDLVTRSHGAPDGLVDMPRCRILDFEVRRA